MKEKGPTAPLSPTAQTERERKETESARIDTATQYYSTTSL